MVCDEFGGSILDFSIELGLEWEFVLGLESEFGFELFPAERLEDPRLPLPGLADEEGLVGPSTGGGREEDDLRRPFPGAWS